jgi:predicted amidohydrolase
MSDEMHEVINTDFGMIGLQICRDILYPKITWVTVSLGAKMILSPAFWNKFSTTFEDSLDYHHIDELQLITYMVPARSLEDEVICAFCNAAGQSSMPERSDVLFGYTQVYSRNDTNRRCGNG